MVHQHKKAESFKSLIQDFVNNETYWDTRVVCKDGVVRHNQITLGLLFQSLKTSDVFNFPVESTLILPDFSTSDVEDMIEKKLAAIFAGETQTEVIHAVNIEEIVSAEFKIKEEEDAIEDISKLDLPEISFNKIEHLTNDTDDYDFDIESAQVEQKKIYDEIKKTVNECIDCGKSFSSLSNLNAHKKNLHLSPLVSTYAKKCPFCKKTFQIELGKLSSGKLKLHLKRFHVKEDLSVLTDIFKNKSLSHPDTVGSIPCHICGVTVKHKRSMYQHMYSQHSETEPSYPCSHCGKQFKFLGSLKTHEDIHTAKESPCDLCGRKFQSPYYLTNHKKRVHEKKYLNRGVCDQCERTFTSKRHLKRHIEAVHNKVKQFPCEICGFRCARIDNLNLHRKKTHLIQVKLTRIALEKMISEGFHQFCSSDEQRPQYKNTNNSNGRINPT